eukprot:scaffold42383_cov62-Attheya_sp.AAC.7
MVGMGRVSTSETQSELRAAGAITSIRSSYRHRRGFKVRNPGRRQENVSDCDEALFLCFTTYWIFISQQSRLTRRQNKGEARGAAFER